MTTATPEPAAAALTSASPPPSPLPKLAEDVTPGARATALQNAFAKALEATLNKCSYDNLASCFPTPTEYRPSVIEGFHKDFTGRLHEVCTAEFEVIMKEKNVVTLLNSLDRLIHEAKVRKQAADSNGTNASEQPIPPHTLPPSELVNAHLASFLTDTRAAITSETTAVETSNIKLMETIKQQRQEMESLVSGLENVVADLERSASMLQGDDVQELTAEVKMVEEELKT